MKFAIKNRWSGAVMFECELSADEVEAMSYRFQLGVAIKAAYERDADLRDADLSGADLRDAVLRDAVLRDADLSGADLRGAVLRDADLSGADLRGAVLRDAVLRDAVLRGADLRGADLRGAVLRDAVLRDAVLSSAVLRDADLSGADLRDAVLSDAVLRDAVLRGADLRGADLSDADLSGAVLRDADLSGADLRGVPAITNIHQTVYAAASNPGALEMSNWHKCDTTHCRAGWVVHLAGAAGAALEFGMGTPAAAAMIYLKSDPTLEKMPNFYADNEAALADMKRLAEAEASGAFHE